MKQLWQRHRNWFYSALMGVVVFSVVLWARYPRPVWRSDVRVSGSDHQFVKSTTDAGYVCEAVRKHAMRWAVVRSYQGSDKSALTFYDTTNGQCVGPWSPPGPKSADRIRWRFDLMGRMLVIYREPNGFEAIHWFNPTKETFGQIHPPKVNMPLAHRVSEDGSTIAIASGGPGQPVRFQMYDLTTETIRSDFELAGRTGTVSATSKEAATLDFDLSYDGSKLAVTGAWNGVKRTTEFGISIIDTQSGQTIRRITDGQNAESTSSILPASSDRSPAGYPRESTDIGCVDPWLFDDGSGVGYRVARRMHFEPDYGWQDGFHESEVVNFDFNHGRVDNPTVWQGLYGPVVGEPFAVSIGSDGAHAIWQRKFGQGQKEVRITTTDGTPATDWFRIPKRESSADFDEAQTRLVPGTTGFVGTNFLYEEDLDTSDVVNLAQSVIDKVKLPVQVAPPVGDHAFWRDWKTGESFAFRVRAFENGSIDDVACFNKRVCLLMNAQKETAQLEMWTAPMARVPYTSSWLAAVIAAIAVRFWRHRR